MKSISITVPMDYAALTRASDMLHGMALDVREGATAGPVNTDWAKGTAASSTAVDDQNAPDPNHVPDEDYATEEKDAAAVFGNGAAAQTATGPGIAPPAETTPPPVAGATGPEPAQTATGPESSRTDSPNGPAQPAPAAASPGEANEATGTPGVELDSDGLPWDARIHAGSKTKLKKSQQWKPKRGVDPDLKAEVEAELRAAMSAGGSAEEPAGPAAPAEPAKPAPPAAPAEPAKPAPAAAAEGAITTFPALMSRITSAGITQEQAAAAAKNQGLPSLPLLATRPDLIPAVAAELFPEG